MRSWLHHPPEKLGRRGAILLSFAVLWVLVGVAALLSPHPPNPVLLYQHLPNWLRFALWAGTGLVAAAHCLTPPVKNDGIGFIALMIMPMERAVSYLWAWIAHVVPGGDTGLERGWLNFLFYLAFINVLVICSGWRENSPVPEQRERGRE